MNFVIGGALLLLSIGAVLFHLELKMNEAALCAILASVGVFHLELARPLMKSPLHRFLFLTSGLIVLATSNLLYALIASSILWFLGENRFRVAHD